MKKIFIQKLKGGGYALKMDQEIKQFGRMRSSWYYKTGAKWGRAFVPRECVIGCYDEAVRLGGLQAELHRAELVKGAKC